MLLTLILSAAISLVNPLNGTDFHGHTFPGATVPFGMVQLSPDTRPFPGNWDGCSGYHYSDSLIYGFSHTHLSGTGCDDLCDILLMPIKEGTGRSRDEYASPFSHTRETATPGYYEVWLEKPQVQVRLTAGRRIGVHQYSFAKGVMPQVLIDLAHRDRLLESSITQVSDNAIQGLRRSSSWASDQSVYFHIEFSRPIESLESNDTLAVLSFRPEKLRSNTLTVRVGISSVSAENARQNLLSEYPKSFAKQKKQAERMWEAFLSKLECPSDDLEVRKTFYTSLYHCAIHPSLYSDYNGEYRGMDHQVHKAHTTDGKPFERYTIFSLWDTFRALHPLLTEIEPERTADFINSFISIWKESGKLPVWTLWGNETNCMIGYNSAPVIADAIFHDLPGFDYEEAFQALLESSKNPAFGMDSFRRNGVVLAEDEHESVSKTLEYAYDDWCVAQVAKRLGHEAEYLEYNRSAQYWRNVFDPETGFMRARKNGRWFSPFDPTDVSGHYTEANAWQYSFFVPHDVAGLVEAFGGREAFLRKLEALFTADEATKGKQQVDITGQIGQYAHGNEPSHHISWLPELLGDRAMTEKYVGKILGELYSSAPDGICGNDDCGQTSAWYVLSLLDRYPVCPAAPLKTETSMEKTIVVNPIFNVPSSSFEEQMDVVIGNIDRGASVWYSINGGEYLRYEGPFTIRETSSIEAFSQMPDGTRSFPVRTTLRKVRSNTRITPLTSYTDPYNAGGKNGLIDGERGQLNWRIGGWQGYWGEDCDAVIDLGSVQAVSEIAVGCIQDINQWIWMPESVEVSVSIDGVDFQPAGFARPVADPRDETPQIEDIAVRIDRNARYLKVHVKKFGTIPQWHVGFGSHSWIFVDEIVVHC